MAKLASVKAATSETTEYVRLVAKIHLQTINKLLVIANQAMRKMQTVCAPDQ